MRLSWYWALLSFNSFVFSPSGSGSKAEGPEIVLVSARRSSCLGAARLAAKPWVLPSHSCTGLPAVGPPHTIEAQLAKLTETPDPQKKVRSMAVFSPSQVLEPRFETRPFFSNPI